MGEILNYQYWASLILKERMGTINDSEAKELTEWITTDNKHHRLYEHIKSRDYAEDIKAYRNTDTELGLKKYKKRHMVDKNRMLYRWVSVAAVVAILFGSGIWLFNPKEPIIERGTEIYPGTAKAELILGDGSVKQLDQAVMEEFVSGKTVINNTGTQIEYNSRVDSLSGKQNVIPEYNELRIPTGGEYRLVMADGTKVWLNSQTRLRFPVSFPEKERVVYLEGEAYFEVAHDATRPFYVQTKENVNVLVLGTSFNVRAYGDEKTVETVLEKGKVRMWHNSETVQLEPGIRAIYSRVNAKINTEPVNTELYTTWREGHFIFQGETIENILQKLSRWYGMNVFFVNEEAKGFLFSGSVRKYETINDLLEAMEISGGIHFKVKGNTIFVSCDH